MLAAKASHPLPISTICRTGLMVITRVSITHLICSFSVVKALIAQRYPSKLYAKSVVRFNVFSKQFYPICSLSLINKA